MNILTYYTESHKQLFERFFKASIDRSGEFTICATYEDKLEGGTFQTPQWYSAVKKKPEIVLRYMQSNTGRFVFSDVDVIQVQPIKKEIEVLLDKYDAVFQDEKHDMHVNSGFYAMNINETTLRFMKQVVQQYDQYCGGALVIKV